MPAAVFVSPHEKQWQVKALGPVRLLGLPAPFGFVAFPPGLYTVP